MSGSAGRLVGIGGVFLHADDPAALAAWYAQHLGCRFEEIPGDGGPSTWFLELRTGSIDEAVVTHQAVFAIMPLDASVPSPPGGVTVNLRVDDLTATVASLRDAGLAVDTDVTADDGLGTGRFVRLNDPAGHRLELWQHLG